MTLEEKLLKSSIALGDYNYAVLDGTAPDEVVVGTQCEFLPLPTGWELAPDEPQIVEKVVAPHGWGTHALVLENGRSYFTKLQSITPPGTLFQISMLARSEAGVKAKTSNLRVLIRARLCAEPKVKRFRAALGTDLWSKQLFTDCVVVCNGEETPCHRAVLARGSAVFCRMLSTEMSEAKEQRIEIRETDPRTVRNLVHFLYAGELESDDVDIIQLLSLAECYNVELLAQFCAERALDHMNSDNVISVARAFKCFTGKTDTEHLWQRLLQKLNGDKELLHAALMGL